ncbi:MAG: YaiO family outer membrane beta-barrel protein [Breznakibacter sp.]
MSIKHFYYYLVLGITLSTFQGYSQYSPEYDYAKMREAAFNGKYLEAKAIGAKLLNNLPDYHDAAVLLGRVYMWGQQYDSAKIVIDNVLEKAPLNSDAIEAKFDLAYFSGNSAQVIAMGDSLIKTNPERIDFKEKVALSYLATGQVGNAEETAKNILSVDPENKVALRILDRLNPKRPWELTAGYSFDHFETPYNRWWHLWTIGATKKLEWGSLTGRLNVGHINAVGTATELQGEVESNLKLSRQAYMMMLYGYSPGDYFPTHKATVEVWHKIPYQMVVSLGSNFYYWDEPVFIGTVSLEKYAGSYWFCLRNYLNFKDVGPTASFYFTVRRYFDETDYFQATLGYGAAPDEPFDIKTDLERLNASSVRLAYLKKLSIRTKLRLGIGYAYEEYTPDKYRHRFDGTLSLIYSFGK